LVADDVKAKLSTKPLDTILKAAIHDCYKAVVGPDTELGRCIAGATIELYRGFVKSEQMKEFLRQYPSFAADIALNLHGWDTFGVKKNRQHGSVYGYHVLM